MASSTEQQPLLQPRRTDLPARQGDDDLAQVRRAATVHGVERLQGLLDGSTDSLAKGAGAAAAAQQQAGARSGQRRAVLVALGTVWLYLSVGVLFYHFEEGWGVVDSLYFCTVVLTTVGYGDMTPTSGVSKAFTTMYVILAVGLILTALGYLLDLLLESNEDVFVQALMQDLGERDSVESFTKEEVYNVTSSTLLFAGVCIIGAIFFSLVEGLSFLDAVYFITITSSTVGFGDMDPTRPASRAFAVFFLVLSTLSLARAIGSVTAARSALRQRQVAHRTIHAAMNRQRFTELDMDGDGSITKVEFLSSMLIKLGNCDKDLIDEILGEFEKHDRDSSGAITRAEAGLRPTRNMVRQATVRYRKTMTMRVEDMA